MNHLASSAAPAPNAAAMRAASPRSTLRRLGLAALLALLPWTAGCSATGKWKSVGEPPIWNTELPPPAAETAEPNTISVVLYCPLMEDRPEFLDKLREAIVAQCRSAGMGDVELLQDRSKKAQYEIVVYEAGEDGRFAFNKTAGVLGGLGTAAVTGAVTKKLGAALPAGIAAGGLFGFVFGSRTDNHTFAGVCRQRTSLKAEQRDETNRDKQVRASGSARARSSTAGST